MNNKKWLSYHDANLVAISESKKFNLFSETDWRKYIKDGNRVDGIPTKPNVVYKDTGWINWKSWFGNFHLKNRQKNWLPYILAKKRVKNHLKKYNIKTAKDWFENYKFIDFDKVPYSPQTVYKENGWVNWKDWLDSDITCGGDVFLYDVNHNFFSSWSSSMAYVLGLWFADGHMYSRKRKGKYTKIISIKLHSRDSDLLNEILSLMGSNHILYQYNDNCSFFSLTSSSLYDDIIKIGGEPNKSLVAKFPNINDKFLPDFIRGYFDGDGSIFKRNNRITYNSNFSSASSDFIYPLMASLSRFGVKSKISKPKNGNTYILYLNSRETIKLGEFMYGDIVSNNKIKMKTTPKVKIKLISNIRR